MTLTKRYGYGVTLGCDPAGGTAFVILGNIVDSIEGPEVKTDDIEVTLLADKDKTFLGGQIDGGTVSFQIAYDPLDTSGTTIATLLGNSNIANWQIKYPVIGAEVQQSDTFFGYVNGFKRSIKRNALIVADISIKVTGTNLGET
jgi:hypothetical protein